jgi:hypothetical protein
VTPSVLGYGRLGRWGSARPGQRLSPAGATETRRGPGVLDWVPWPYQFAEPATGRPDKPPGGDRRNEGEGPLLGAALGTPLFHIRTRLACSGITSDRLGSVRGVGGKAIGT